MKTKKIACFLPSLFGGGAEKAAIKLFKGMSGGDFTLDLVLADATGPYLNQVPKEVRVVDLGAGRVLKAILPLARYLKHHKPDALISHLEYANVAAALAKEISGTNTKLVLVEQNNLSASIKNSKSLLNRVFSLLVHTLYPRAGAIVGVSKGVAEDLESILAFPKGKVHVIHNPIVDDEILKKAQVHVEHPWFKQGEAPVFVAVGRLSEQKDFQNLIQAFSLLRKQKQAKLIILGEGELRAELELSINALGIAEDISLPGFVDNPYAYMYNAKAFVLSSRWEGLPTVIIEAMACGCSVVSTNCPSGPNEILDEGKYGYLVPVQDSVALSEAMVAVLDNTVSRETLLKRAQDFSVERSVSEYLSLLFAA
ncbi:glycosyl transferase, group 1 family protein [Rivularia sp. IAM M-261]|nr:glycosyl transferase, group 1 family protein [Calothrix sp. PCC 7716]GJD17379.1 glycosyl transferase, group 1 family protein [Rivularia sp. IAM M-261]